MTNRPLARVCVLLALILLVVWGLDGGGGDPDVSQLAAEPTPPHASAEGSSQALVALADTTGEKPVAVPLVAADAAAAEGSPVSRNRPLVKGRVLAGDDPVENAYVYAMDHGAGAWAQQHTPPSGEYEIEMPRAGEFEVCAVPPSGRRSGLGEFIITVGWGDMRTFDIQLGRCGFSGIVREATTSAVLGDVSVTATGKDANGMSIDVAARADAEGRFRLQPLLPGNYSLHVEGRTYSSPMTEAITLGQGERRTDVVLRASPDRAELRVDVAFGPREDLRHTLSLELVGAWNDLTRADPRSGSCLFEALRPGPYMVRLRRLPKSLEDLDSTDSLVEQKVEVKAGESVVLFVAVPEGT